MADETKTENEQMVPKSRLDELIRQRDEARTQVTTLEGRVQDMTSKVESYQALASESEKFKEEIATMSSSRESERTTWQQDRALLQAGIQDDDVGDLIKLKFGKQDTETDFGKWVEGESAKEYVKPFLSAAVAPTTTETPTTVETTKTLETDPANKGNPVTPSPGNEYDPISIRNMDPKDFAENADSIIQAMWPKAEPG